jgi:hypothetical protein
MIKQLVFAAFLLVFFLGNAQANDVEKISIHFNMFKRPNVTYTVDFKKNEMTCVMLRFGNVGEPVFDKKYVFTKDKIVKLQNEINKDVPATVVRVEESAIDGGGFTITYFKTDGKTSQLIVNNPILSKEKFIAPLLKIKAFFNFAYSVTRDPDSIELLDSSYSPYYSGLPVRLTFNNPLEYKIWGVISGGEFNNKELFAFLDNLPHDKCVIIDCNYNLSYALQEAVFKLYIIKYSNLKFINNDYLKYTREKLFKIRDQINKAEDTDFEKDATYALYMTNPKAIDKWLALPEGQWNMSIRTALKKCQ